MKTRTIQLLLRSAAAAILLLFFAGCPSAGSGTSDETPIPQDPPVTTAPDAPTGLQASDGTYISFIRLTWNPSYGAEGYEIYWSDSASGTYQAFDTSIGTTYDDYDGGGGATYFFKIKAYNQFGYSDFSNYDSGWAIDYTGGSWTPPEGTTTVTAGTYLYDQSIGTSLAYKSYKGWMTRGQSYTITIYGFYHPADADLQLYNSYGDVLAQSTSGGLGIPESISYSCQDTGYYYFRVTNPIGDGFDFDFSFVKN